LLGIAQPPLAVPCHRRSRISGFPPRLGNEEFARGGGTPCREGDVVFARSALIGMAFNLHRNIAILLEPGGLAAERFLRFRGERRLVDQEVDAVANIDGEVLL